MARAILGVASVQLSAMTTIRSGAARLREEGRDRRLEADLLVVRRDEHGHGHRARRGSRRRCGPGSRTGRAASAPPQGRRAAQSSSASGRAPRYSQAPGFARAPSGPSGARGCSHRCRTPCRSRGAARSCPACSRRRRVVHVEVREIHVGAQQHVVPDALGRELGFSLPSASATSTNSDGIPGDSMPSSSPFMNASQRACASSMIEISMRCASGSGRPRSASAIGCGAGAGRRGYVGRGRESRVGLEHDARAALVVAEPVRAGADRWRTDVGAVASTTSRAIAGQCGTAST